MTQEEFTTVIIRATPGYYLTEVADVPLEQRSVATAVAVGRNREPGYWKEISEAEAQNIRNKQDELRKQQREEEERKRLEEEEALQHAYQSSDNVPIDILPDEADYVQEGGEA